MASDREERAKQVWIAAKEILERAPHAAEFVENWKLDRPADDTLLLVGSTNVDLGWNFVAARYEHAGRTQYTGTVTRQGLVANLTRDVAEKVLAIAEKWAQDHAVPGAK